MPKAVVIKFDALRFFRAKYRAVCKNKTILEEDLLAMDDVLRDLYLERSAIMNQLACVTVNEQRLMHKIASVKNG